MCFEKVKQEFAGAESKQVREDFVDYLKFLSNQK
jgi:hypothetical protein